MADLIELTKDRLQKIFSKIKGEIESKDTPIIAAMLNGRQVTYVSSDSLLTIGKNVGDISYWAKTGKFYLYTSKTAMPTEITLANITGYSLGDTLAVPHQVAKANWANSTPFKVQNGVVTSISKGETTGGYTRWILVMLADSEDQTYTAGVSGNTKYFGTFNYSASRGNVVWELWLPMGQANNTVIVDW